MTTRDDSDVRRYFDVYMKVPLLAALYESFYNWRVYDQVSKEGFSRNLESVRNWLLFEGIELDHGDSGGVRLFNRHADTYSRTVGTFTALYLDVLPEFRPDLFEHVS